MPLCFIELLYLFCEIAPSRKQNKKVQEQVPETQDPDIELDESADTIFTSNNDKSRYRIKKSRNMIQERGFAANVEGEFTIPDEYVQVSLTLITGNIFVPRLILL